MTEGNGNKIANRAILALSAISVIAIVGGVIVAVTGPSTNVGAVFAIVTGAVGGIVAIVLRTKGEGG